jgi:NADH dehydrogenase [ubiquinone] 1 alpha subcomplex assembly factor 1
LLSQSLFGAKNSCHFLKRTQFVYNPPVCTCKGRNPNIFSQVRFVREAETRATLRAMKRLLISLLALGAFIVTASASEDSILEFSPSEPTWYVINDGVMGGVSSSSVNLKNGLLEFSGTVRLENNGGFASVRSTSAQYDLSTSGGVKLRVRGDGKRYAFQIGTSSAQNVLYRAEFSTINNEWLEVSLAFSTLRPTRFGQGLSGPPLDLRATQHFGFIIANKRAESFKLEVDWIRRLEK